MKIVFDTSNAYYADYDYPHMNIARTLREIAEKIENGQAYGKVRDGNGNLVGTFDIDG